MYQYKTIQHIKHITKWYKERITKQHKIRQNIPK